MLIRMKFMHTMPYVYSDESKKYRALLKPNQILRGYLPPKNHNVEYFFNSETGDFSEYQEDKPKQTKVRSKTKTVEPTEDLVT